MPEDIDNEEWYDEEIAPVLKELALKCRERGVSFLALVNYRTGEDSDSGLTITQEKDASADFRVASYAARSWGNVDALIKALQKDGRKHGHNSIYLHMLEKEETP